MSQKQLERPRFGLTTPSKTASRMNRRSFLKTAAGGATLASLPALRQSAFATNFAPSASDHPNILFLVVDQLREPQWFPPDRALSELLPAYSSIRRGGVNFGNAYSAATLCSPARAGLLTGLYTHQNGLFNCVDGEESALNTGFKTWGGALRDLGYDTNWYGKWHLSYGDSLDDYGFGGGTFPSPNGGVQEGTNVDSHIVDQFVTWLDTAYTKKPWATTVSLVNPHDIVYYYKYTEDYFKANPPRDIVKGLPKNFETPQQLQAKPRLQQAHQLASERKYGPIPSSGEGWEQGWLDFANAYIAYQQLVDHQIGRVLAALDQQPKVRDNTVIVFLSDHGEYCGSHGLRGKGGSAYDEVIRVPLTVKDPTGRLTAHTGIERQQFVSLLDIYGLLLTVASGSDSWRGEAQYSHLAKRADVASLLTNPKADGRPYVIHTYDDGGAKTLPGSTDPIPNHAIGLRTHDAKLVLYNKWSPGTIDLDQDVQETELYDYSTLRGRLELDDVTKSNPALYDAMYAKLTNEVLPGELREPLPAGLDAVREIALADHYAFQKSHKKKKKVVDDTNSAAPTTDGE